jgi:GNAT superfamily N-acetyltransferase
MSRLVVDEVRPEHFDDLAALAAGTHARARQLEPLLPEPYSDPAAVRQIVAAAAQSGGFVAHRGGQLTAGIVGGVGNRSETGGAAGLLSAQVPVLCASGHPDDLADCYAAAAREWVNSEAMRHVVTVLAGDRTTHDTLVSLGFGREQAYAVREIPPDGSLDEPMDDRRATNPVTVRRATSDDLDLVLPVTAVVTEHQRLSPTFSMASAAWFEQLPAAMAVELADETAYIHVAVDEHGTAVGLAASYDEPSTPIVPELSVELSLVGVRPDRRGLGIGSRLTAAALEDARLRGRRSVHADWRTTNLLSARYWPRRGFRPVAYRMVRTIDMTPF